MGKKLLTLLLLINSIVIYSQCVSNQTISNINNSGATLNWTINDPSVTTVNIKWRKLGCTTSWNTSNACVTGYNGIASSSFILDTLNANTEYEWRIKWFGCTPNPWTNGPNFTTSNNCNIIIDSIVTTDALCSMSADGSIDITVSGGIAPYTYSWSNGSTTEDLIDVPAGTYTVQITDNLGCIDSATATIGFLGNNSVSQTLSPFSPNPISATGVWSYDTLELQNTGCETRIRPEFIISSSSGNIQQGDFIIRWFNPVTNGWPELLYSIDVNGNAIGFWSTSQTDTTGLQIQMGQSQNIVVRVKFFSQASYGDYSAIWETMEVDALGNLIGPLAPQDTVTLSYVNCSNFSIDSIAVSNITCNGNNDGSASVIANNIVGSGNYSFLWSNGSTNSSITNLSSGTYSVIVTDNLWGCIDSSTVTINEPGALNPSLTGTNISCYGGSNGTLSATVTGGSGTFDFFWASHPFLPPLPNQTNLLAGTYTIDVIDLLCGNVASTSYTIFEPNILTVSNTLSSSNTSCDSSICNGTISISLSGGTTPYIYNWTNGYTDSTRTDLCGDTYSINLSDINGCGNITETIIIADSVSPASASVVGSNISCFGSNDGSAEAIIGGGNTPNGGNISTLTYCASSPGTNGYNTIDQVNLIGDGDTINNNTSGSCDTYEDYTTQYATLTPGSSYTINVQLGSCHGSGFFNPDSTGVFIDWNIDGDFDDINEKIDVLYSNVSTTHNITITVPNIAYGPTRMRIVSQSQINNPSFPDSPVTACAVGDFGQNGTYSQPWYGATEDYSIVISGVVPATYLWNTGDTTSSISNLSSGTYYCQVTDTNNCSATDSVTITQPDSILTVPTITNVSCNGGNDGSVTLNISGGTAGYTQDWGINNPNALSAGTYNYTVTDNNGCTFSDSVNINEPNAITNTEIITNVLCYGATTGSIDVTINGGVSPYTYNWSNGSTSEDLNNVAAGTYTITVTDDNSCIYTNTFTINQPTAGITVSANTTDVSCNGGNDGTAVLTLSGGTGTLSVDWGGNNPTALTAGIYSYTITDSVGCSYTNNITINEPNSISIIPTINNVSCFGLSDGNATLAIAGGTPNYAENWGTNNPNALSAGTYNYTITDNNGCTYSDSITITEPQELNATFTQTNVSCFGGSDGSATVSIIGGTINYILSWDTLSYPLLGGISIFNTPIGVPAGIYPFGITDANGCYFSDTIIITEPSELIVSETINNVSCFGLSDGNVSLNISGGTPSYTEDWGTNNPNALPSGTYLYTVTDTNGCVFANSINIIEPNDINTSLIVTNLSSCVVLNGAIDLSVTGGTTPYNFAWNNNDTTEDLDSLGAGTYYITITDNNGCIANDSAIVNQPSNNLLLNPSTINYNGFGISCYGGNDGGIFANASGGTGILSFQWSDMSTDSSLLNQSIGTYSVTVTDSVGCSYTDSVTLTQPDSLESNYTTSNVLCHGDSTGEASGQIIGGVPNYNVTSPVFGQNVNLPGGFFGTGPVIPAGSYPYLITDGNGCIYQDTIIITQPDPISSNPNLSNYNGYNISCHGGNNGSVTLTITGGTAGYTQDWGGVVNPDSLYAGIYSYTLTDNNGCTLSDSVTISEPIELISNLNPINLSCYNSCDGEISVQVSGGVPTYNYTWDNGLTGDTINNLCAGTYSVIITDQNSCTTNDSIIISQPSEINILIDSVIHASIYNGNDGSIYISTSGGIGGVSYSWNGPLGFSANSQDIFGLLSGYYTVIVSDSTNCYSEDTIFVDQPPSLSITLDSSINASCFGICDGQLYITPDGGDSVYTYLWTGPNGFMSTNQDIDSLCSGTYELMLSDTTNSIYASFTISEPTELSIVIQSDTALCYGGTAQSSAYAYGGQYPYQTLWSNGSTSITTYLTAGMHHVSVTDANGCISNDSIHIIQNDSMHINIIENDISCFGLSDGSIIINIISGGTSPYTFSDDNGQNFQNSNTFTNLSLGSSDYIIMDDNGCTISSSANISQPNELLVTIDYINDVSCYGDCDGSATVIASGGTGSYYINWGGLDSTNLCAGLANIIVRDDNNCFATNSVVIDEPNPIIVSITANGNSLEATAGFLFYQWIDDNGNPIIGATSSSFTPTSQGQYAVEVTDINNCVETSEYINFIIESIDNINNILHIFPNPTSGIVNIEILKNIEGEINVINTFGKEIINIQINESNENLKTIDLSNLSKGIYIIQLINNNDIINHRIILQ